MCVSGALLIYYDITNYPITVDSVSLWHHLRQLGLKHHLQGGIFAHIPCASMFLGFPLSPHGVLSSRPSQYGLIFLWHYSLRLVIFFK